MVSVPASSREHVDAVLGVLVRAGLSASVAAPPARPHDAVPYCVVWPSGGGVEAGSLGDPSSDLALDFQVTSVGATAEQALWEHDKATRALHWATPAVTGRAALPVRQTEAPEPVRRDDSLAVPLFYVAARWRLTTMPA